MVVTLSDIAKRAGVSSPIVSAVVNRSKSNGRVSEDTRQRILKIAKELGYVPNAVASSLARGRTKTIGIMCHSLTDPNLLQGIVRAEELCGAAGYKVEIAALSNYPDWSTLLRCGTVELLIFMGIPMIERIGMIVPEEIRSRIVALGPTVNPDYLRITPRHWGLQVLWDDRDMGRRAGEHLIGLGHRKIGLLGGNASGPYGLHLRVRGAKEAIEAAGGETFVVYREDETDKMAAGEAMTRELLCEHPEVTALFMRTDLFFPGVLMALAQAGRRVPEDMSLIGCIGFYSQVTCVKSPMAREVEHVLAPYLQSGRLPSEDIILPPEFNPGRTCTRVAEKCK